jgi:predicted aldo/keto reductase-like oxidoreductase
MRKVRLGRTNLEVTKWALGGITLSTIMGGTDEDTIQQIIKAALDYGINLIDTSRAYMDSETNLGLGLEGRRDQCFIASKTHSRTYDEVLSDVEESLNELQTDKIEIYQVHEFYRDQIEAIMGKGGVLDALKKARSRGMIDFIGFSSHDPALAVEMMKTDEFDTVMIPFNVIEREPEKELFELARKMDIGTLIMKPVGGGAIRNIEKSFKFLNGYPVDVILNGVVNLEEFYGNIKHAENTDTLTPEELKAFEEEVAPLGKDFCRRCSYCMPCPIDIIVPIFIHTLWQKFKDRPYAELSDLDRKMGTDMMLWWQACEECGQCEDKCPYDLPTIKRKNDLIKLFSVGDSE